MQADVTLSETGAGGQITVQELPLKLNDLSTTVSGSVKLEGQTFTLSAQADGQMGRAELIGDGGLVDLLPSLTPLTSLRPTGTGYRVQGGIGPPRSGAAWPRCGPGRRGQRPAHLIRRPGHICAALGRAQTRRRQLPGPHRRQSGRRRLATARLYRQLHFIRGRHGGAAQRARASCWRCPLATSSRALPASCPATVS